MRYLLTLTFVGMLSMVAAAALAQERSVTEHGATPVVVDHPWARATPGGALTGAVYMTITNAADSSDRLTGATSPVADRVQIHEMKVENGIMHMRELPNGLTVPANGSVTLKPGSYHGMLTGLKGPLKKGEHIPLTLTFEKAGTLSVSVPVLAMGAMSAEE
ncbi:MAG: copper chaperone PCu(A)C [Beijerinckiaceae bacterium]